MIELATKHTITNHHSYTVDIIRAVSAILIVLYHYTWRYNENEYVTAINVTTNWKFVVSWGCGAVCTFFMLSGFLLSKHFENIKTHPKEFLLKRFVRLYPTFWVCMTITALVLVVLFPEIQVTWVEYFVNLTMLPSLFKIRYIDGAYWTMAYEIIFTLIFCFILSIKKIKIRKVILLTLLCASFIEWGYGNCSNIFIKFIRFFLITNQIQVFIIGICIYYIKNKKPQNLYYYVLFIICCILQILQCKSGVYNVFFFITILLLFTSNHIDKIIIKNYFYKIIEFIALISYPLYLLHQMIGFAIIKNLQQKGYTNEVWIILPIIIVLLIAFIIHKYIEKPSSKQDFSKWPKLFCK